MGDRSSNVGAETGAEIGNASSAIGAETGAETGGATGETSSVGDCAMGDSTGSSPNALEDGGTVESSPALAVSVALTSSMCLSLISTRLLCIILVSEDSCVGGNVFMSNLKVGRVAAW